MYIPNGSRAEIGVKVRMGDLKAVFEKISFSKPISAARSKIIAKTQSSHLID